MPLSSDCPGNETWQSLLDATLPPEQRRRCERHLEACAACQDQLDRALDRRDPLLQLVRQFGDPTTTAPPEATLVEVLHRLQQGQAAVSASCPGPADLSFLRPSDRPGVLGLLGAYEVQEVIGQGGMGVVLKAYEPGLNRLVAIKVLSPALAGSATARKRFTREAQAAAAVCHEHIVAVHSVQEGEGLPYFVMQLVNGESLQQRLDRAGPLEVIEVIQIGWQTAAALAAAHSQGLIHRDIKPANILLEGGPGVREEAAGRKPSGKLDSPEGLPPVASSPAIRVKITDFGLARLVDDVGLTQNGVVAGTPEYMAPEQARGEAVDHRADLFSLGSVLFACCTGRPPFQGGSALAVLRQVAEETPVSLRGVNPRVPAWLEDLIARLMARDRNDRLLSAAEVAAVFKGFLARISQAVPGPVKPEAAPAAGATDRAARRPKKPGRPRGIELLLPAGFLMLGLGLLAWQGVGIGPEDQPAKPAWQEYSQSFRGSRETPPDWNRIGPDAEKYVHLEPDGLRISLPANYPGERPEVGLYTNLKVQGDFEITVHMEVLQQPDQAQAGPRGTRCTLGAAFYNPNLNLGSLSYRVSPSQGDTYFTWISLRKEPGQNNQRKGTSFPARGNAGRFRLARSGVELFYSVAPNPEKQFTLLHREQFGDGEIRYLVVGASTGSDKAEIDVRITDLHIRAESLPDIAPAPPPTGSGRNHWLGGLLLGLVLVLVAGVWLVLRCYRVGQETSAEPEEGARPVSWLCSGCRQRIKAQPALVGKEVLCPRCGQKGRVPGPST